MYVELVLKDKSSEGIRSTFKQNCACLGKVQKLVDYSKEAIQKNIVILVIQKGVRISYIHSTVYFRVLNIFKKVEA